MRIKKQRYSAPTGDVSTSNDVYFFFFFFFFGLGLRNFQAGHFSLPFFSLSLHRKQTYPVLPPSGAMSVDLISPYSLSIESLNLSDNELKTYPRWYTDLIIRKQTPSLTINDVFSYMKNFGIKEPERAVILSVFVPNITDAPPQIFYACLRLASHLQQGQQITTGLVFHPAPVPRLLSIISKTLKQDPILIEKPKAQAEASDSNPFRRERSNTAGNSQKPKMDITSFTAFLMTGSVPQDASDNDEPQYLPPKSHNSKRVTFDTNPPQVAEAAARSMEELLRQQRSMPQLVPANRQIPVAPSYPTSNYNVGGVFNVKPLVPQDTGTDPVDDVNIETDTFKNVNIDSVLHNGVSNLPPPIPQHRASVFAEDNHTPSPPPQSYPSYQQQQHQFGSGSVEQSHQPPPLPPKVREPEQFKPLAPSHTGPVSLPALVPTPTGPIMGNNGNHNNSSNNNGNNNGMNVFPPLNGSGNNSAFLKPPVQQQGFSLSPQSTGHPPPVPPTRPSYGDSFQNGNISSPSLAQFESIFHTHQQTGNGQTHPPPPPPPPQQQPQQYNFSGAQAFLPEPPFTATSQAYQGGYQVPGMNGIPPPPPRRSVSSGTPITPLQSTATGNQMMANNGFRRMNIQSQPTGGPALSQLPTMNNGVLAPPPPPSRRRLQPSLTGGTPPLGPGHFQSSSATNLPSTYQPQMQAPQLQQPGGQQMAPLQGQYTGHQVMYSSPTGSNSVPNLLSNEMANLNFGR